MEVLIALAILSGMALAALRLAGDGLTELANNGWRDRATLLGRNKMLSLEREGSQGAARGDFGPDHPEIKWRTRLRDLGKGKGRMLELSVEEGANEVTLEKWLAP